MTGFLPSTGGGFGATGRFAVISDNGEVKRLSNKPSALRVGPDAIISVITAGAGGYGNPEDRSTFDLEKDLRSGKFSTKILSKSYPQFGKGKS